MRSADKSDIGVCTLSLFYEMHEVVRSGEELLRLSGSGARGLSIPATPSLSSNRYCKVLDFEVEKFTFLKFAYLVQLGSECCARLVAGPTTPHWKKTQ